ncbi:MAG TPA: hypothetical protein VN845_14605 [Solirubrobacteraceae bacterium]|nr:hypothetical protein [Solirubrobacteraceae bacterium]
MKQEATHTNPDDALVAYQRSLDRVFENSRHLMATAPTWQASLYHSVRACYTEMHTHPDALHLHFVVTTHDPLVQRTRARHRDRLLALLQDTRQDAPTPLHAELLLSMIHATMRMQIATRANPPDLDTAEHTFATLLFHYGAAPQHHSY